MSTFTADRKTSCLAEHNMSLELPIVGRHHDNCSQHLPTSVGCTRSITIIILAPNVTVSSLFHISAFQRY